MIVDRITFKAVIPTRQYENIQPEVELKDVDLNEGMGYLMPLMEGMIERYSEHGKLKTKEGNAILVGVKKKSFNEDVEVDFEPVAHVYKIGDVPLVSATTFIKKFYKEFDKENVSKASSKSWNVDQGELKELWKSNGELTAEFGTVVHKALEHYEKFKGIGAKISEVKDLDENYALPKHPLIRSIITGFSKLNIGEGDVVTEALITNVDKGICGHADRILVKDWEKKICRVGDYKINIGSETEDKTLKPKEPFEGLPQNKLTKYQLQMSVYANMLTLSGWTVEGLDAFVFEDEWKHYPLEVLQVL